MVPSFSMTLRTATFRSFLTVASFATILAQITRAPTSTANESGSDEEKAEN
jgi:hypothetical protein